MALRSAVRVFPSVRPLKIDTTALSQAQLRVSIAGNNSSFDWLSWFNRLKGESHYCVNCCPHKNLPLFPGLEGLPTLLATKFLGCKVIAVPKVNHNLQCLLIKTLWTIVDEIQLTVFVCVICHLTVVTSQDHSVGTWSPQPRLSKASTRRTVAACRYQAAAWWTGPS